MVPPKNSYTLSEGENSSVEFKLDVEFCPECGSVMRPDGEGEWMCSSCHFKSSASSSSSRSRISHTPSYPKCYGNTSNEMLPDGEGTLSAKVDRISKSGNGIIELPEGHINLGRMSEEMVGEEVVVEVVDDVATRAITDEEERVGVEHQISDSESNSPTQAEDGDTVESHGSSDNSTSPHGTHTSTHAWSGPSRNKEVPNPGEKARGEVHRISELGNGIIQFKNGYLNVGEVPKEMVGKIVQVEVTNGWSARILSHGNQSEEDSLNESNTVPQSESHHEDVVEDESDGDEETASEEGLTDSIDELRRQAEEKAVEEVSESATTTTHEKPEYNRSAAVKRYVKARADGMCEGCNEPAPFTSATGEPYLHAHHVHELSNSGSDTPDTVIALCPNCHYRVHHGQDGDEFNQTLIDTLCEIEDVDLDSNANK